ncbi:MAG: amidohydrolase [Ginsengibacter sp.]
MKNNTGKNSLKEYILTNVRLEEGFNYDNNNEITGTKTSLFDIHIKEGKIKKIAVKGSLDKTGIESIDAKDFLMLPVMKDMHIHIDKTYYGSAWRAAPRKGFTVKDMIRLEEKLIPELLPDSKRKAEESIKLLQSQGSTFARCQCNIDPVSGLKSLEHLISALNEQKNNFDWEIVAFPQHGILYSKSEGLLREAAKMGVDFIGGLDPTIVDGAMEKSLDTMFNIALDNGKGVDIHLHEGLPFGKAAMEYMIKKVTENKALQGKTFISHGFALAEMEQKEVEEIAEQFAEYGIGVISSIPIGRAVMPIPTLKKYGVKLMTGTDSIIDHWMPFGSGDMMEKANLCAQLYGWTDEYNLNRSLHIATDDILPLDDRGNRVWPNVGMDASFVLVNASCSAEAVARLSKREAVFHFGTQIV